MFTEGDREVMAALLPELERAASSLSGETRWRHSLMREARLLRVALGLPVVAAVNRLGTTTDQQADNVRVMRRMGATIGPVAANYISQKFGLTG